MKNFLKTKNLKWLLISMAVVSCSTNEEVFQSGSLNSENEALATPTIGNTYYIVNKNSKLYMDIEDASNNANANLQQFGSSASLEDTHKQWEILSVGDGYVRLKGVDSGKTLEVEDGNNSNGSNVEQNAYNGETHQEWELISTSDGYFRIKGRDSGKSISVEDSGTSDGDNIEIAAWSGSDKFQWFFLEVGDDEESTDDDEESTDDDEESTDDYDLDPNVAPSENFDLSHWKITLSSGAEIFEDELSDGYTLDDQFYTADDGGMVFKNYPGSSETGTTVSSTYSRVELREMLRESTDEDETGINSNNWVFGTSSEESQELAGAVDGILESTLVVNHVTATTENLLLEDYETEEEYLIEKATQNGRIIIGQIHASDDEPCRLYYHKQPGHSKGAIYLAHEPTEGNGDEQFINLIGNYTNGTWLYDIENAVEPENGIALGEEFSYKIDAQVNTLIVTIYDANKDVIVSETIDMSTSGFSDDYMYFKAGVYSGNKYVGNETDYEQVTFYNVEVTH